MAKKYVFKSRNTKRDNILGYSFIAPWIVGLVIFSLIPIIMVFVLSFFKVSQSIQGYKFEFLGFANYTNAFLVNTDFTLALVEFIALEFCYVPVIIIVAFIVSLVLNMKIKGKTIFRTIFFIPVIILSGPLVELLFDTNVTITSNGEQALETTTNLTNSIIYRLLSEYSMTLVNVIQFIYDNFVMLLWFTGIPIVLFINGLQKINKNIFEAAQIDGANSWQILWKITIPMVRTLAFIISIFVVVQLSIFPTSNLYQLIVGSVGDISRFGIACCYSVIYAFVIILLILVFYLIFVPRNKKVKEVITYTQKKQLDITLKNNENKFLKRKKRRVKNETENN